MASYQATEHAQISVSTTDGFAKAGDSGAGAQEVYLNCAANDCYVTFDTPATTTTGFLLKANLAPTRFVFSGGTVNQVHAITSSGTTTLYITFVRR